MPGRSPARWPAAASAVIQRRPAAALMPGTPLIAPPMRSVTPAYPRTGVSVSLAGAVARAGNVTDMRSTSSLATVLASSFSARSSVTLLVARATGDRARTPATGSTSSRSGPAGSALTRLGQRGLLSAGQPRYGQQVALPAGQH